MSDPIEVDDPVELPALPDLKIGDRLGDEYWNEVAAGYRFGAFRAFAAIFTGFRLIDFKTMPRDEASLNVNTIRLLFSRDGKDYVFSGYSIFAARFSFGHETEPRKLGLSMGAETVRCFIEDCNAIGDDPIKTLGDY